MPFYAIWVVNLGSTNLLMVSRCLTLEWVRVEWLVLGWLLAGRLSRTILTL